MALQRAKHLACVPRTLRHQTLVCRVHCQRRKPRSPAAGVFRRYVLPYKFDRIRYRETMGPSEVHAHAVPLADEQSQHVAQDAAWLSVFGLHIVDNRQKCRLRALWRYPPWVVQGVRVRMLKRAGQPSCFGHRGKRHALHEWRDMRLVNASP